MPLKEFELSTPRMTLRGLRNSATEGRVTLALHGWLDNAASFVPLYESLQPDAPFIAIDLPGHGKSEHRSADASYYLMDYVLDVAAAIALLAGERPVQLVGHSLGGVIAVMVAASMPEQIHKVVLLDSLGPYADEPLQTLRQLRKAVNKIARSGSRAQKIHHSQDDAVGVRMAAGSGLSRSAARLLCERGLTAVAGGFIWSSDPRLLQPSLVKLTEAQVQLILSGVECPVLLLFGSDGFVEKFPAYAERMAAIPHMSVHQVRGGHHFHMDGDVAETATKIKGFL